MEGTRGHAAATVEFRHVTKHYAPAKLQAGAPGAVNDLSFRVPAGRVCVLVGPSGCGKTTTLKLVNRLVEPSSGQILLDGDDIANRDPTELRRGIGYVIQQVGLFPHETVEENIGTVPRLLGWPRARRRERAHELLELVGLPPDQYAGRYPAELSGGERQRVGVARALAADPPILLMDEPFGAVDPIVRERLQNELLRIQERLAKTILFVTHDIDEAMKMGDLVAVMAAGGRLAQFGTPAEILTAPASEFVARFVGADRGLKRLALVRVGELPLRRPITARIGDPAGPARARILADPFPYLLVVDPDERPLGWLDQAEVPEAGNLAGDGLQPALPILDRRTTLKDALSMLLDADVQAGIVVDHGDRVTGLLTIDDVVTWLRSDAASRATAGGSITEGGETDPPGGR
ncbi:MAG: ABC transporter ATP-binding protein [Chloroflexota bacterium]